MRKIHHLALGLAFFAALAGGAACDVRAGYVEPANNVPANGDAAAQTENSPEAKEEKDSEALAETQPSAASVAGTYKYETYRADKKQGYVNSLEIEAKPGGKLEVYFDATYAYPVSGGDETFKTASGGGVLTLRGSQASGAITEDGDEESGAKCSLTIVFTASRASVKPAPDCQFNVSIEGVYTKETKKTDSPKPANLREIKFEQLRDFVNDFEKNKTGERFVMTGVPAETIADIERADAGGNQNYKGFYYLVAPEDGESAGFLTAPPLLRSLQANNDRQPQSLRVTAVLVQSDGKFDVYRLSFVTKIEGLDAAGEVIWTATGDEPSKIKFRH